MTLRAGAADLRIDAAAGGRITGLRLAGEGGAREILRPFPDGVSRDELLHWPKGGIYPLLPYSNRIRDARLSFGGRDIDLTAHPDAAPHTLHGHAHRVPWTAERIGPAAAVLRLEHEAGGEWPWRVSAEVEVALEPASVRISLALRNEDRTAMPAGIGLHPYFTCDPRDVLAFDAPVAWEIDADTLAVGPTAAETDHRSGAALPAGEITLYRGGWTGRCVVARAGGDRLEIAADPVFSHLVVHRPASALYLCVEPVSHVSDGFNLAARGLDGTGTRVLEPGDVLRGTVTISLSRAAG